MADGIPSIIRRAGNGQAPKLHTQNFGMNAFHNASVVHQGGGSMPKGSAGHAGAGKGSLGSSLAGGQGLAQGLQGGGENDPVLSGNFEKAGRLRIYGIPIGEEQLSAHGKDQQAASQRIQAFSQDYLSQLQKGLTPQQAFGAAVKNAPSTLNDFMAHPTALRSLDNLTKVLTPAGPMQTYSGVSKQGQQITFDENGKAIAAEDVPGFKTGQEAGTGTGKTFPQTYTKPDGTPGTRQMQYTRGPNGLLQAQPVEGSEGEIKQTGKQAGAAAGLVPSDIAGLPPQVTADIPKTAFNRQNMNALEATPTVMAALDRMKTAAAGMGPVKGPVSALSGEYFGLNGTGAQFKADMDLIRTQAPLVMGSGYKAAVEAFMTGIGSTSNAPSFLRLQANQMQTAMRNRAQEMADAETTSHQGKLPPSLANQLIGQGVVPNGYQNQTTFDRMPAGEAPLWKSRYAPQAINHEDQVSLFTDAAHGKFGPLDNPSDDLKNVLQIHQNFKTQQQAKAQQGTASTAAANASAGNAGQLVSGLGVQPAEGTEPGAQQPEQAGEQPQQPAQQQPQQGAEQPQAQPQGQQQLGQQGQGDQSGQNIPLSPQQQPLMPPTAVPGQPAQGVPGTDGVTPLPPANPLPKTSQMLTPQGSVPTPGSQAPTQDTAPKVSEPEVPSPYSPTFSGM